MVGFLFYQEVAEEAVSSKKELIEYKRNMHEKFNKLEEAYRSYRREMETKHADMLSSLDEVRQQYDNATFNIEELKSENCTIKEVSYYFYDCTANLINGTV